MDAIEFAIPEQPEANPPFSRIQPSPVTHAHNIKVGSTTLTDTSVVKVGDKLTPVITGCHYGTGDKAGEIVEDPEVTGLEDAAAFTWTVGETSSTGSTYTVIADDEGFAWNCEASGIEAKEDGALIWGNGLVITK